MLNINNVVGKLPTFPPGLPPHIIGGGVVFSFVSWLVELKEMLLAIVQPIEKCRSIGEVFWTYLHLDSAHYLGVATWIAMFILTTYTLVGLVLWLTRKRH